MIFNALVAEVTDVGSAVGGNNSNNNNNNTNRTNNSNNKKIGTIVMKSSKFLHNKVISGFQALRLARAPVEGSDARRRDPVDLRADSLATVPPFTLRSELSDKVKKIPPAVLFCGLYNAIFTNIITVSWLMYSRNLGRMAEHRSS
ncbi:hypothetical protein PoB_001474100 [Plakobranchus ocellatus]|uniref:Uncharacterized protein n=1 Tax=Plakobranchus ocellatus TaxID=259542 RepID=A0AAV3YLU1_9GAST|nr:hypothetical protein PoB_001474100 [Plakobranchus ocellatus]